MPLSAEALVAEIEADIAWARQCLADNERALDAMQETRDDVPFNDVHEISRRLMYQSALSRTLAKYEQQLVAARSALHAQYGLTLSPAMV